MLKSKMLSPIYDSGVFPNVVDSIPDKSLEVTYENVPVSNGNVLTPTQVKNPPSVSWDAEEGDLFTLVMTDPDAPSRENPQFREWHHWLVVNIPGCKVNEGETLSEYIGAGPPKQTGFHRYIFILYRQPKKISFKEPKLTNRSGELRANFSTRKFAKKYGLGEPIAINFFTAEWDTYVPELYKQLEG